jgi:hypothetical protein
MIYIDLTNGEIKFEKWIFSPKRKLDYYNNLFSSPEMELLISNRNWLTYRLSISEYFIFTMVFENETLRMFEIYPTNVDRHNGVSFLIEKLGGEHIYSWGKIELNDDIKASYKSVLLTYTRFQ